MILSANTKEAARSLYATKQRSLLALVGIIIGIGSVIAMISIGTIVKSEALKQFQELGTDFLTIRKISSSTGRSSIRLADAVGLPAAVAAISTAAPWIQSFGEFVYAGKQVGSGGMLGVTAPFVALYKLPLASGRFLSDLDFRRSYCVIGADTAQAMRSVGAKQIVGEPIKLAGRLYTIVGVLQQTSSWGMRPFNANQAVFVPITTAQSAFDGPEIESIIVRVRSDAPHTAVTAEIDRYFSRKVKGLEINVESAKNLIEQMQKQQQLFALLLGAVGSISLIVGGVGVMNVMLVSVAERRQEIGIRRALGARRGDIQGQFLIESLILSLLGGVFGIALGFGTSYGICLFSEWTFLMSPTAVVLGVGVASGVGILFGFWPAYQAARLDPIAALRAG